MVMVQTFARGALLAAALTGCTKFASELDQVTEGLEPPPELPGDAAWGCLSEPSPPEAPPNGPALPYPLVALDFVSSGVPQNLRGRACYRADVDCIDPALDFVAADDTGTLPLELWEGFNGYIEIVSDDMVPTLLVFPAPLTPELAAAVRAVPVSLLPYEALLAFGRAFQLELNPEAGVISVTAYDCSRPAVAGVRLQLNSPAIPFTFVDGLPIAYQDTTSEEGTAGFANVTPGLVVLRGFLEGSMDLVGLETVPVRAGWVTVASLMPQFAMSP